MPRGELRVPQRDPMLFASVTQKCVFGGDSTVGSTQQAGGKTSKLVGELTEIALVCRPPEVVEMEGDGIERRDGHGLRLFEVADLSPAASFQSISFEGVRPWVEQPGIGDTELGVDRHLDLSIDALRRARENLAHPVGHHGITVSPRKQWHPFASPACKVGDVDLGVTYEVQLRLVDDPPSPWAASTTLEWSDQIIAQ